MINIYHKTKSLNNISPNIDFFPSGEIALLLQKTFSVVLMSRWRLVIPNDFLESSEVSLDPQTLLKAGLTFRCYPPGD